MPQSRVWKHLVYENLPKALTDIEQYERKRPRSTPRARKPQVSSFSEALGGMVGFKKIIRSCHQLNEYYSI